MSCCVFWYNATVLIEEGLLVPQTLPDNYFCHWSCCFTCFRSEKQKQLSGSAHVKYLCRGLLLDSVAGKFIQNLQFIGPCCKTPKETISNFAAIKAYVSCKTLSNYMKIQRTALKHRGHLILLHKETIEKQLKQQTYCVSNMHLFLVQPKDL